ncbi:DUF2235 domain-containing protein [Sphingomonas koreensis]|nr:DUF2235 domain-containing protein [Sphingomonas koreensis]
MPKNIVVFSDGTGQDGGVRPDQRLSNVYKLYRACRTDSTSPIDPAEQIAFYDPGLGTDDDVHGFVRAWRTFEKLLGSVAGRGIGSNIIDCYEFIINHWQPGDRIYIIGFSRGAYTARCVAQVLSLCGVPRHEPGDPDVRLRRFARSTRLAAARAVHQVYEHGAGHPLGAFETERNEQARRFRVDYGSDADGIPNAAPYFIGVFDTVAALGAKGWRLYGIGAILGTGIAALVGAVAALIHWIVGIGFLATFGLLGVLTGAVIWTVLKRQSLRYIDDFPTKGAPRRRHWIAWHASNYDRGLSHHVGYARHASAIDEDRADFPRVGWGRHDVVRPAVDGQPLPLVQLWFAGDHSDIGGGYRETESRLSDISLQWMVDEATTLPGPLIVNRAQLAIWPDPAAMQHSEVVAVRDRTLWWVPKWSPKALRDGWAAAARAPAGEPVHPSVFARFGADSVALPTGEGPYRPVNLASDPRFTHFYDGHDPVTSDALAAAVAALPYRRRVADRPRGRRTDPGSRHAAPRPRRRLRDHNNGCAMERGRARPLSRPAFARLSWRRGSAARVAGDQRRGASRRQPAIHHPGAGGAGRGSRARFAAGVDHRPGAVRQPVARRNRVDSRRVRARHRTDQRLTCRRRYEGLRP